MRKGSAPARGAGGWDRLGLSARRGRRRPDDSAVAPPTLPRQLPRCSNRPDGYQVSVTCPGRRSGDVYISH